MPPLLQPTTWLFSSYQLLQIGRNKITSPRQLLCPAHSCRIFASRQLKEASLKQEGSILYINVSFAKNRTQNYEKNSLIDHLICTSWSQMHLAWPLNV